MKLENAFSRNEFSVLQISNKEVEAAYSFQLVKALKAVSFVVPVELLK